MEQVKVEDFLYNDGRYSGADRYQAQQEYNAIHGIGLTAVDKKGRSSLLSNFLALATVDDQVRTILRGMKFPGRR